MTSKVILVITHLTIILEFETHLKLTAFISSQIGNIHYYDKKV